MHKLLIGAAAACAASAACAQGVAARDPLDPKAPVPPLEYRSPFADYRSARDLVIAPWRESNDEVKRLGGHMGHVTKTPTASQPQEPAASSPPEPASGHAEHRR
jgi:hypothetical protein